MGTSTRGRRRAALLIMLSALGLLLLGGGPAHADGAPAGNDVQVAQTLGDRDLTVILRRIDLAQGPLQVDVVTHAGSAEGPLTLRASAAGSVVSETTVTLGARPGLYSGTLRVDRPGPWELTLDDGTSVGTIPFLVPARVVPPWEKATYGGFVAAGVFLVLALVVAVRSRRGQLALLPAGGMVAALAVAVTGALLSASTPPPPAPGTQLDPTIENVTDPYANAQLPITDYSRPPLNMAVHNENARAGQPGELRLALSDGSTGRPADDLLVHDNALVHLVVVSPSGRLWHLHPVRVGPGDYRVRLTPPESGTYAVSAELARRGGGVQLLRSSMQVNPGTETPATAEKSDVRLAVKPAPAGTPTTITAQFPAADLQPWLGMLGHLIVTGPLTNPAKVGAEAAVAPTWAHVHAMTPVVPGMVGKPDETVAAFGPDVSFTYTFAAPGRYRIWLQAERNYSVVTIPAIVDVPATEVAGR